MRAKLCVLGAVLGTASVLPGVCMTPVEPPMRTTQGQDRSGTARPSHGMGDRAVEPQERGSDAPKHPCELITVIQVPCDPATATCEFTYWECPSQVSPLRA